MASQVKKEPRTGTFDDDQKKNKKQRTHPHDSVKKEHVESPMLHPKTFSLSVPPGDDYALSVKPNSKQFWKAGDYETCYGEGAPAISLTGIYIDL